MLAGTGACTCLLPGSFKLVQWGPYLSSDLGPPLRSPYGKRRRIARHPMRAQRKVDAAEFDIQFTFTTEKAGIFSGGSDYFLLLN